MPHHLNPGPWFTLPDLIVVALLTVPVALAPPDPPSWLVWLYGVQAALVSAVVLAHLPGSTEAEIGKLSNPSFRVTASGPHGVFLTVLALWVLIAPSEELSPPYKAVLIAGFMLLVIYSRRKS